MLSLHSCSFIFGRRQRFGYGCLVLLIVLLVCVNSKFTCEINFFFVLTDIKSVIISDIHHNGLKVLLILEGLKTNALQMRPSGGLLIEFPRILKQGEIFPTGLLIYQLESFPKASIASKNVEIVPFSHPFAPEP